MAPVGHVLKNKQKCLVKSIFVPATDGFHRVYIYPGND